MKNSHIEWTDHTFNPWIGCERVSTACVRCYIERSPALRFRKMKLGDPPVRTGEDNWKEPLAWNRQAEKAGKRFRVFCLSLGDWLDARVPIEWLADLLKLIHDTPHLDWLLLTKRPENWSDRLHIALRFDIRHGIVWEEWLSRWLDGDAPDNVWIGTTVENQAMANQRIPQLLSIPARVRFLSCEPLLENVDLLRPIQPTPDDRAEANSHVAEWKEPLSEEGVRQWAFMQSIHWIICGGESGPGARPMRLLWARDLRDQCQVSNVPFFFKQWGEWAMASQFPEMLCSIEHMQVKVGKRAAGRLLDGREWSEFPHAEVPA